MARRMLVLPLIATALVWGPAVQAGASPPATSEFDFRFVEPLPRSMCGYPLQVTFEGHAKFTRFFDQDGNLRRLQFNARDVATVANPANGKTLTGHEVIFRQVNFEKEQEFVAGLPIHFGNAVMEAGRVYFNSLGEFRFSGNFQFSEGDLSDFCAALA